MTKQNCPYCRSQNTVWRGFRYNEKGKKHLRLCKACGRKFTPHDKFFRMRFSPEEIREAVKLYKVRGFSSGEAQKHLKRKGIRVSRWTIILWSKKYKDLE